MGLITLITDFGSRDHFVGVVKGVILSINPSAKIVDITHEVSPQNIREAAFYLLSSYRFFPEHSVHVVVVDPGVGSKRRALACRSKEHYFVVPDNGILTPLLEELEEVVVLDRKEFFLHPVSKTFHARDIFAPCSAHLSRGMELAQLGTAVSLDKLVRIAWHNPRFTHERAEGEILHIDRFGNIITNFEVTELLTWKGSSGVKVILGREAIENWVDFYAQGGDVPFLIEGSSGYLEISLRNKSAAQFFRAKEGDRVVVVKNSPPL